MSSTNRVQSSASPDTAHSPLPWHIGPLSDELFQLEIRNAEYVVALATDIGNDRQRANAEFIVRAANNHYALLEALEAALPLLQNVHSADYGKARRVAEIESAARAAIARAKGETA
jgi:hypothetical protein